MARPRTPPVINPQAYAPTVWQDGVTPVNAANLNKLEQGLAAAVGIPADVVVSPATALLIRNRLNAADTQPAFRLGADGKLEWGPGGSAAPDNTLYRVAAGILQTNSTLGSVGTAGYFGFGTKVTGNPQFRWGATNDGTLYWGDGGGGQDTTLYRSSAGYLTTDGGIIAKGVNNGLIYSPVAAGGLALMAQVQGEAQPRFYIDYAGFHRWGDGAAAPDTNLYRSAAGVLKTDGHFAVGGYLDVDRNGVGSQLRFGSAMDTNLYRSAAGKLATDSTLVLNRGPGAPALQAFWNAGEQYAGFSLERDGTMSWGPGGAAGPDTILSRSAANTLKTANWFEAGNDITANVGLAYQVKLAQGGGQAAVYFGSAGDTTLYRSAAGMLKTDGALTVVGSLDMGGPIYARAAGWGLFAMQPGDSNMRVGIYSAGSAIYFGPGNATEDTNLSRLAPGVLGINGVPIGNATRTRQYPLKLMAPRSSAFAGNAFWTVAAMAGFDYPHWEFVKDVEGRVFGQILSPKTVAATPNAKIVLILCCMATAGVSRMNVNYALLGTTGGWLGGSLTPIGAQDVAMPATTSGFVKATFAVPAGIAADQMMFLEIVHEGNHANDTLAVNTILVEAYLEIDS